MPELNSVDSFLYWQLFRSVGCDRVVRCKYFFREELYMIGENKLTAEEFVNVLIEMGSIREGPDWYVKESSSLICLELVLNQRVGVERATAAAVALHDHFIRPFHNSDRTVSDVTNWPYLNTCLRRPARSLARTVNDYFKSNHNGYYESARISELPSSIVGALASRERYYNRCNGFFDMIRAMEISSEQISSLTPDLVYKITKIKLPMPNIQQQIYSAARILELKAAPCLLTAEIRRELIKLPRIGHETADSLLVFLFKKPAIIIDEYLRRVSFRHLLIDNQSCSRVKINSLLGTYIHSHTDSFAIHARLNEIGVLFCLATQPRCMACPLGRLQFRV